MLLHYHVSQAAREHILKEVASRVQSKFAEFLDPMLAPPFALEKDECSNCSLG